MRNLIAIITFLLLAAITGCGTVGPYRGPEPFGEKAYAVYPPDVTISRPVVVVLLVFKDDRPANEHDLDWTRQANAYASKVSQPREVRTEFHKALLGGLSLHQQIQIIPPEIFLRTKEADLVISGRVLKCEADRRMGWSEVFIGATSTIEVTVRDGRGKYLAATPLQFTAKTERPIGEYLLADGNIRAGLVGKVVEESIEKAAQEFLASREFAEMLALASGGNK